MRGAETPEAVEEGLRALVKGIGDQLPSLDAERAGAERYGAPRLSPYDLFRPNENALSRVVGDLFDPRGTHGQGPLFLNALLGALGLPRVGVRDVVHVRREVLTEERRRIDIVIETPAVLLGIENKPWAGQQRNQLSDYHRELKNRAAGHHYTLVFLSDQEEESAAGEVVRMPYQAVDEGSSLHGVLSSVVGPIRAARARTHVEDFIRYIELEFGEGSVTEEGDEPHVRAVQAEFDGSPAKKKALAAVLLAQSKLHAIILDEIATFLLSEVKKKVNEDFVSNTKRSMYECLKDRYVLWTLSRPSWPIDCFVCLESQSGYFKNLYFGVRAPDPKSGAVKATPGSGCKARPKLDSIRTRVRGGGKSIWWPWWQHPGARHWGPEFAARLVLESPAGRVDEHPEIQELGRQIVQLAEAVEIALKA